MNKNRKKLKMTSLFSGAGMQERGVEQAGFDIELVNTCEMDINAIIAYAAIHNGLTLEMVDNYDKYPTREEMAEELIRKRIGYDFIKDKEYDWKKKIRSKSKDIEKTWLACKLNNNVGDIMKVDTLDYCDLLTWSFPCTDLSVAGKGAGLVKSTEEQNGTRSGLVYEVLRILWNMKKDGTLPETMIMENVDALLNKKNIEAYNEINKEIEEIGFNAYVDIMNTKYTSYSEHPVPQNRSRAYCMYIRKDIDNGKFEFPKKFDAGIRLKDILFDEVDDKYYINNTKAQALIDELILNGTLTEEEEDDDEILR